MYRSFVSLGRYTPKYFIPFVAMVNGIVSLISLSVFSLLVYRNAKTALVKNSSPKHKNRNVGRDVEMNMACLKHKETCVIK